ncbi:hypothetical protein L1987_01465 [Smallanthus sonchifolius]|uniref:Uncharacterized protein n=1 Tax=Smallanthus sonchifolius TaxID=185202 RepID=A0ACB9K546_9ASTR|nr:hypothetical protein L1987_01465 [Smallanthus sonchifolius]
MLRNRKIFPLCISFHGQTTVLRSIDHKVEGHPLTKGVSIDIEDLDEVVGLHHTLTIRCLIKATRMATGTLLAMHLHRGIGNHSGRSRRARTPHLHMV